MLIPKPFRFSSGYICLGALGLGISGLVHEASKGPPAPIEPNAAAKVLIAADTNGDGKLSEIEASRLITQRFLTTRISTGERTKVHPFTPDSLQRARKLGEIAKDIIPDHSAVYLKVLEQMANMQADEVQDAQKKK